MKTSYVRFGRRFPIPSTAQILDELKTDFVPGYVPISRGFRHSREVPVVAVTQANPAGESAVRETGPKRREDRERKDTAEPFLGMPLGKSARLLERLEAAGGHEEAHTGEQREALMILMRRGLINRTTYKGGLVIYEITDTGRRYVRAMA